MEGEEKNKEIKDKEDRLKELELIEKNTQISSGALQEAVRSNKIARISNVIAIIVVLVTLSVTVMIAFKQVKIIDKQLDLEINRFKIDYFPSLKAEILNNNIIVENTGKTSLNSVRVEYYFNEVPLDSIFTSEVEIIYPGERVPFYIPDNFKEKNRLIIDKVLYSNEVYNERYLQRLYPLRVTIRFDSVKFFTY